MTANKALLAEDGGTLFAAAEQAGRDLYFEAAVAGAIPIIRPLRESLVGDEITSVIGIVNGTTNFILDKMDTDGAGFAETLAEAQELGYAEADPTADVEGFDAAAKAAILCQPRLPYPGHRRRRLPRGHHRGDHRRHRLGARDRLRGEAAGDLSALAGEDGAERHRLGTGPPGDDPAQPSARGRRRRLQRGLRRVRGRPAG